MERNLSADHQGIGLDIVIDGLNKTFHLTHRHHCLGHPNAVPTG